MDPFLSQLSRQPTQSTAAAISFHPSCTAARTPAADLRTNMESQIAGQEQPANAAAVPAAAVECDAVAEPIVASSGKSKNQRKKANRKAKVRASNATVSSLLAECKSLRHSTVMGLWFGAFHSFKGAYRTYYVAASELSDECLEWIFLLTKINMQRMYQRTPGWGWNDKEKRAESRHPDARYFIMTRVEADDATSAAAAPASNGSSGAAADTDVDADGECGVKFEGTPIGFCQVRFLTGDEDHAPIAYVYELQLEPDVQRQGLGRFLMSLVELVAWRCQLLRVVLTVFHSNKPALRLYKDTLHYELDETDPSLFDQQVQYTILAKKSKKVRSIADIVLPLIPQTDVAAAAAPTADTAEASTS